MSVALMSLLSLQALTELALKDSEAFWLEMAQRIDWVKKPTKANGSVFSPQATIRWFEDGELNVCYNCLDRHLPRLANKKAIIFEADEPGHARAITYKQLHEEVCRMASILSSLGVKKGDVVTLYLPMIPELVVAMLACARLGAIHSVVFSGFSSEALAERLAMTKSRWLLTVKQSRRGGRIHDLWANVQKALLSGIVEGGAPVQKILLLDGDSHEKSSVEGAQVIPYETLKPLASTTCPCVAVQATDPLFVLATSGSTGKPKGVVHSSGGYLVYASLTHQAIFDLKPEDVYFCTADIGWITGHTYGVYGPLANAATLVLFQGVPTYPDVSRFWRIIDEHKVTLFYTAPTALRSLKAYGDEVVAKSSLKTLRVIGSVGEPIDPPTWQWAFDVIGHGQCPIMDTWWQTESGGVLLCPRPTLPQKPGCAAKPLFGAQPVLLKGQEVVTEPEREGALCFSESWPGQAINIWGDPAYFQKTYFDEHPGYYTSGDGAKRDADGDFWILGRLDDVLNVSGHRLNSAELEQAVMAHSLLAEACVVGLPHAVKGQGICVFAVLKPAVSVSGEEIALQIKQLVRQKIGPIATPDRVVLVPDVPKTRSGKIIRRLLRKLAEGKDLAVENTSTCANTDCLEGLKEAWKAQTLQKA